MLAKADYLPIVASTWGICISKDKKQKKRNT